MGDRIHSREQLDAGYTPWQRRFNVIAVFAFTGTALWIAWRLWGVSEGVRWLWPVVLVCGLVGSDWLTGMFHWACDTWGTADTPIIGRIAIRTFREHHIDPKAITRHDWAQTNGENCIFSLPTFVALWPMFPDAGSGWGFFFTASTFFAIVFTAAANQMHKWAHEDRPSWVGRALQGVGIVLTRARHDKHHRVPFDNDYCITVGWLNAPLRLIGYWRFLERMVSRVTGWRPRADDTKYMDAFVSDQSPSVAE